MFNLFTALMRVHQRQGFFEPRLKLKYQQQVRSLVGIAGGTEDFVFVLTKCLKPGTKVSSVPVRIVGHATLGHQENAGKFRSEFFLCVVEISKPIRLG